MRRDIDVLSYKGRDDLLQSSMIICSGALLDDNSYNFGLVVEYTQAPITRKNKSKQFNGITKKSSQRRRPKGFCKLIKQYKNTDNFRIELTSLQKPVENS
jgi:hypothetical protein